MKYVTPENLQLARTVRETLARISPDVRNRAHSRADLIVETVGKDDEEFAERFHLFSSLDRAGFALQMRSFLEAVKAIEHPAPEPEHWLLRDARTLLLHYGDRPIEQCLTDAFIESLRNCVWAKQFDELPVLIAMHEAAMKIVHERREDRTLQRSRAIPAKRRIAEPDPEEPMRTLRQTQPLVIPVKPQATQPAVTCLALPPKAAAPANSGRPVTRLVMPAKGSATRSSSAAA